MSDSTKQRAARKQKLHGKIYIEPGSSKYRQTPSEDKAEIGAIRKYMKSPSGTGRYSGWGIKQGSGRTL